jgi:hypothetical protein
MIKTLRVFCFLVFIVCGCATDKSIQLFPVSPGVVQYYIPATDWKVKALKVQLDITYRAEAGSSAVCNVSVIGKDKIPPMVSSISLIGDGVSYSLENISIMFADAENRKLRLNTTIAQDNFLALLKAELVSLALLAGGNEYQFAAPKDFYTYKEQLVTGLSYTQDIP